jgi:allantoicase
MTPIFKKTDGGDLYAFLKKDRLFHLKINQYGKGDGFEFRVYKTRATVLKHLRIGGGDVINFLEFQMILQNSFVHYLEEITLLLPKELQQANNNTKRLN